MLTSLNILINYSEYQWANFRPSNVLQVVPEKRWWHEL